MTIPALPTFILDLNAVSCTVKLYNEDLHKLYSSPSIIRGIKPRRIGWAGYIAHIGRG
jgi:hypothetical protein